MPTVIDELGVQENEEPEIKNFDYLSNFAIMRYAQNSRYIQSNLFLPNDIFSQIEIINIYMIDIIVLVEINLLKMNSSLERSAKKEPIYPYKITKMKSKNIFLPAYMKKQSKIHK